MPARIYFILTAGALLAALGQVLFKLGATGRETIPAYFNAWIYTGLLAYGLGTLLWIHSLSKARLTVVYPFTALTFILVYLSGVILFNEPTTAKALVGVGMILGGLFLISAG